jgi:riboflavin synthase
VDSKDNFSQLRIAFPSGSVTDIKLGASVAINGTCLTVTQVCARKQSAMI